MSAGLKKAQAAASSFADTIAGALSFQKSLTDLVRGIRNNKGNESAFISQCINEIKNELKNEDKKVKMVAVQKLTYVRHKHTLALNYGLLHYAIALSNPSFDCLPNDSCICAVMICLGPPSRSLKSLQIKSLERSALDTSLRPNPSPKLPMSSS